MALEPELREPRDAAEFAAYYDLRWRILREPWTQLRESSTDEFEENAKHIAAWVDGRLVGTGRLHFNSADEAQVRFMAVEHGYERKGIGAAMLQRLEELAAAGGATYVTLNARENAREFYEKHGYAVTGRAGLLFDQIPHWKMGKHLSSQRS